MIFVKLSPDVRFVFARIASLSFCMLLGRGKRCAPLEPIAQKIKGVYRSHRRSWSSPDAISGRLPPSILAPEPRHERLPRGCDT